MAAITTAGENLITSLQSQGKVLVIDKMILANISGLDASASVDRSQGKPTVQQIVSQEDITQAGVVENNSIVYSQVLGSDVGTWTFNWLGLYCSEHDTVVAIAYEPLQEKRATVGEAIGNVITKNFAIEFNGASNLTGINISAESWQIDFNARLLAMDEIQRDVMHLAYGDMTALNSGFNVFYSGGKYFVTKGQAIVKGLLVEFEQDVEIFPPYFPCVVYVDVWQEKSLAGITNKAKFFMSNLAGLGDYTDGLTNVFRVNYSEILSPGVVGLHKQTQTTSFKLYHQGNMPEGSKTEKGIVKFGADDSTSESEAINAKLFSEHSHDWSALKGKPTEYPPSSHGHGWSEISGKPSTYPPSSHGHAWSEISGKPSTYPASTHGHGISDVTGLQDALDAAGVDGGFDDTSLLIVYSGSAFSVNLAGIGPGYYLVIVRVDTVLIALDFYQSELGMSQGGSRNYQVTSIGTHFSVISEETAAVEITTVIKVG